MIRRDKLECLSAAHIVNIVEEASNDWLLATSY